MKRALAAVAAALMLVPAMMSQPVEISPRPQKAEWGTATFARPAGFKVKGAAEADGAAVALLRSRFADGRGPRLVIGERGDRAVAAVEHLIPDHPQGYYLKVTPDEVTVAGADGDGTFYGVQTLLAVAGGDEVTAVEIADWPETPNRGVVEGFYGNAWSYDDRASQFEFYGRHKLDTYIYGPKNDPYHRGKWRELYPEADAENIRSLVELARANKVRFVWGLHPALDHTWTTPDDSLAVRKLEQLYSLGVRDFAVFFDDVFGMAADGRKHAVTMDYIMRNFVDAHPDIESMIMCPALYNKAWAPRFQESYLEDISTMDPFIQIMWTGDNVVVMLDTDDLEWVNPQIGRKAFVWHNYPVSDYAVDHLLMGPYSGNDPRVPSLASGFTANPMEYAEASKVALAGVADYLWNPGAYDADRAWEVAVRELVPDHAAAFRTFCTYNIDPGQTAHRFRRDGESPELLELINRCETNLASGDTTGLAAVEAEFARVEDAAAELLAASDSNRLLAEVKPWLEATRLLGMRGQAAADMYRALLADDARDFVNSYLAYSCLTDRAGAVTSRSFPGSIKTARPVAGSRYAEPFVRRSVAAMTESYLSRHSYRADLFPHPPLPNGSYIIKVDSLYLGNPDAGSDGAAPRLQAAVDDVNPDRQLWRLEYRPETKSYTVSNVHSGAVLNNMGRFADAGHEAEYVFDIAPAGGGAYSLRTTWSGYSTWLGADADNAISRRMKSKEQTLFEIIPAEQQ